MEQPTKSRNIRAMEHFSQQADDLRERLADTQTRLNYHRQMAAKLNRPDPNTNAWIETLSRREKDLKFQLNRALFNAGRR